MERWGGRLTVSNSPRTSEEAVTSRCALLGGKVTPRPTTKRDIHPFEPFLHPTIISMQAGLKVEALGREDTGFYVGAGA